MFNYKQATENQFKPPSLKGRGERISREMLSIDAGQLPVVLLRVKDGAKGALLSVEEHANKFKSVAREEFNGILNRLILSSARRQSIEIALIGGADESRWKVTSWQTVIEESGLSIKTYDLYGQYYRKIYFNPQTGDIFNFKEKVDADKWNPSFPSLSIHDGTRVFQDGQSSGVVANATQFFRQEKTFTALRELILPNHFINYPGQQFKFWSAACSNGAEAYSYAMYIHRLHYRAKKGYKFIIYATDINTDLLAQAKQGEYDISQKVINDYKGYFELYGRLHGTHLEMSEKIKKHIQFQNFDLRNTPNQSNLNVIICANVFQYYKDEARFHFLKNFLQVLNRPGYLHVGPLSKELSEPLGLISLPEYQMFMVK